MMILKIILSLLFLTLYACTPELPSFNVGTCFIEKDGRYIASTGVTKRIYRVDKVNNLSVDLSVKDGRSSWLYMGKRPRTYFTENPTFSFREAGCPQ